MRGVSEMAESTLQGRNWNKLGEVRRGNMESRNTILYVSSLRYGGRGRSGTFLLRIVCAPILDIPESKLSF